MASLNLTTLKDGRKAIIIRTSDRIAFKSCRRKWGWSSHLKFNLGPKQLSAPLWFGSAIHYALEDFHGYNVFGRPADAFRAYCLATAKNFKRDLPHDAADHYKLGQAMMNYYQDMWLEGYPRKADETYWCPPPNNPDGAPEPQVEVNFEIEVPVHREPLLAEYAKALGADVVLYRGTIDRISIDEWGQLWVVEYKTAKIAQNTHYQTDPQVTTYVWACSQIYDRPVAGVIYQQFVKKFPEQPKLLATGKISTAQNLVTSYPLYKSALESLYGDVMKSPSLNQAFMNRLIASETDHKDRYIIREPIFRNSEQCMNESWKIMMELEDMLNPNLPLYPNPTRDCSRMCSFLTPCVNLDDGSDWELLLEKSYASRDQDQERYWRRRLPSPAELKAITDKGEEPDLHDLQIQSAEEFQLAQIAAGDYELSEFEMKADSPFEGMNAKGSFNMNAIDTNM